MSRRLTRMGGGFGLALAPASSASSGLIVPANALQLNGQTLQLNGQNLTLGA